MFAAGALTCIAAAPMPHDQKPARAAMIAKIKQRADDYPGLAKEPSFIAALAAIAQIDRAAFVPKDKRAMAWQDQPLPIGYDQTISDPAIVAMMTAAAGTRPGSNIFEVGTGSGYQAAVLGQMGATVHSIEIVTPLARLAARRLRHLKYLAVSVRAGDGFGGWPDFAPYDGIIVTAGGAEVPAPLVAQLKPGGKLVMPIGANVLVMQLVVFTKQTDASLTRCSLGPALFVPLTGKGQRPEANALYDRHIKTCYKGQTARWPGQVDEEGR